MKKAICLVLFLIMFILSTFIVSSDDYDELGLQTMPGGLIEPGENITVSGYAKNVVGSTSTPITGRNVSVQIFDPSGTSYDLGNILLNSDGEFTAPKFGNTSESGKYSISVMLFNSNPLIPPTLSYAFFDVEPKRQYLLYTDSSEYSLGDTVTITVKAYDLELNGSKTSLASEIIPLKIFFNNGESGSEVYSNMALVLNENGTASETYTIPEDSTGYGFYTVSVKNGYAQAMFEVSSFDFDISLFDETGSETKKFSSENNLSLDVSVTQKSGDLVSPVSGATVTAIIKKNNEDDAGTAVYTFSNFAEVSGAYSSQSYDLSDLSSGEYYVEVSVTKSGKKIKNTKYFKIKTLDLELEPLFDNEAINSLLKNDTAAIGINVRDLATGKVYAYNELTDASIIECNQAEIDCMNLLSGEGNLITSTDPDFIAALNFTTPLESGVYRLKIRVNISSEGTNTYVDGVIYVEVDDLVATVSVADRFANLKANVMAGETMTFDTEAWLASNAEALINQVEIISCVDDDGVDVTEEMIKSEGTSEGSDIDVNAPADGGCYTCILEVTTDSGMSSTSEQICVEKYDIWADSRGDDGTWQWRFQSTGNVYFHVNVMNDVGYTVPAADLTIEVSKLTSLTTGKTYLDPIFSVMPNTSSDVPLAQATSKGSGVPVVKIPLASLNLPSGIYRAEFDVTDDEGTVETGDAFFQISNLDVSVTPAKVSNPSSYWPFFKPSSGFVLNVLATDFEGVPVVDGSTVNVDKLLLISGGATAVSTDLYDATSNITASGAAQVTVTPKPGKTLPSGMYLAFVNVNTGSVSETREAWLMVKAFHLIVSNPFYHAPATSLNIIGFVVDPSSMQPKSGVGITFDGFYDSKQAKLIDDINFPDATSNSAGMFTLAVNSSPVKEGEYIFGVSAFDSVSGTHDTYDGFLFIKNYASVECELVNSEQVAVAPGTSVEYKITVTDKFGSGVENVGVEVSKFTNTESNVESTALTTTAGTTNSNGVATLTFKAPNNIGYYRPLLSADDVELTSQEYAWGMIPCEFAVAKTDVDVELYDDSGSSSKDFMAGENITVGFLLSNPSGGAVSMNELKLLSHMCAGGDCLIPTVAEMLAGTVEVTTLLGAKLTSVTQNKNLTFTAPTKQGAYSLNIQTKDSDNSIETISKQFKVVDPVKALGITYNFWQEQNMFSTSDSAKINFSNSGPIKINATRLLDMDDASQVIAGFMGSEASFSEGTNIYSFSVPNNLPGNYEVELCVYPASSTCTNDSDIKLFNFYVESEYFSLARPFNPDGMYLSSDLVDLEIALENKSDAFQSLSSEDITLVNVKKDGTIVSNFAIDSIADSSNVGWELVSLNHTGEVKGWYDATFRIDYAGGSYDVFVGFKIKSQVYNLNLIAADDEVDTYPIYGANEQITFNVSMGDVSESGELYIRDNQMGEFMSELGNNPFTLSSGFAQVNLAIPNFGDYDAVAFIPSKDDPQRIEAHYGFGIKSGFDIFWNHENMNDHIGVGEENLTLNFTVTDNDGNPMIAGTKVNVSIIEYHNPMNWDMINDSVGITGEVTLLDGGIGVFEFDPTDTAGEYGVEIEFEIGANIIHRGTWFKATDGEFHVFTNKQSYASGELVTVIAKVESSNGAPVSGVDVELVNVSYYDAAGTKQGIASELFVSLTNTTDEDGRAETQFNLPPGLNTNFNIEFKRTSPEEFRSFDISSSGYQVEIFEESHPPYAVGDMYIAKIKVMNDDGTPANNIPITYTVKSEFNDWTIINDSISLGNTNNDGKVDFSYLIPDDFMGFYDIEFDIGDGARKEWRGFMISPFDVMIDLRGEITGDDKTYWDWEIPSAAEVVTSITLKDSSGSPIQDAEVSIKDVFKMSKSEGPSVDVTNSINFTSTSSVTDSEGNAEIRFTVAELAGDSDYDLRVEVNVSNKVMDFFKWFRLSAFTWEVELAADPSLDDTTYYQVSSKGPGDLVFVDVNVSGDDVSNYKVCLDRIENTWTWNTNYHSECYDIVSGDLTSFNFTAPSQSGEYNAWIVLKTKDNDDWLKDQSVWFDVKGGAEADYEMHTWINDWNVWSGSNATVVVELWNRNGWQDVDELSACGNVSITEVRDQKTWNLVATDQEIIQDAVQMNPMQGPPGAQLEFLIDNSWAAGEYNARVNCENLGITRDVGFNIVSFQVSSLIPEFVQKGENVSYWIKSTYANGTPLNGGIVTVKELRNMWNWGEAPISIDEDFVLDANGEFIGEIVVPQSTGGYELIMEVTDGETVQEVRKQFEVRGMNVEILINGGADQLYSGEDLTLTVLVVDSNGLPSPNARVNLDVMRHWFAGGGEGTEELVVCSNLAQDECSDECIWNVSSCIGIEEHCQALDSNNCNINPTCNGWWADDGFYCGVEWSNIGESKNSIEGWYEKYTNMNGEAKFKFAGDSAPNKGEYEFNVNVDAPGQGWFWSHKTKVIRKFNLSLSTDSLKYSPGDTVNVNVSATYSNGTPLGSNFKVDAGLEEPKFAMSEQEMDCMNKMTNETCSSKSECEWMTDDFMGGDFGAKSEELDAQMLTCNGEGLACMHITDSDVCTDMSCTWNVDACEGSIVGHCNGIVEMNDCESTSAICMWSEDEGEYVPGNMGWCGAKEVDYDLVENVSFSNGLAQISLDIPSENVTAGSAFIWVDIIKGDKVVEFIDSMILIYDSDTADFELQILNPVVGADEFIEINLTTSEETAGKVMIDQMVKHLQSENGAISMQEMMGGGQESGKTDWLGSPIYINPNAPTHFVVLSRARPGTYTSLLELRKKGSSFFGPADMAGMLFANYEVNSTSGECSLFVECDDNNSTTRDVCLQTKCTHYVISEESECSFDGECPNYPAQGLYGVCDFTGQCNNISGECEGANDCDDTNTSTFDYCDNYMCEYESTTDVECTTDSQCTDIPPEHVSLCEYGECHYVPEANIGCNADSECIDQYGDNWFCDMWDKQCHEIKNCECDSVVDCAEEPYGVETVAVCECMCDYFHEDDLIMLYDWDKSTDALGNMSSGILWGWNGTEGADEAKPFEGSPGGDIVFAQIANDSTYMYTQMKLGGFEWNGGLPYCEGSFPSDPSRGRIYNQSYVAYYNTIDSQGSTLAGIEGADFKFELAFGEDPSYVSDNFYFWSAGQWVLDEVIDTNYSITCKNPMQSIDFKVLLDDLAFDNESNVNEIILATRMTDFETYQETWTVHDCFWNESAQMDDCFDTEYTATDFSVFENQFVDLVPNSGWHDMFDRGWDELGGEQ
ncbi:hypothetical protein HN587_06940 [Candidatus Woesearchaeota archaeon]|jgi:5-hydroxyisourate hydrolase-like protein (transthyretin family)|nr:hypothetical protein [Candidatus Woesearchaeota archaeon]